MHLLESGEMYLESILQLTQKQGHVRSVDVSEHMGYSKPSVSRAVGLLKNGGYILVDNEEEKMAKLLLTYAAKQTIRNGLALLGIAAPERM